MRRLRRIVQNGKLEGHHLSLDADASVNTSLRLPPSSSMSNPSMLLLGSRCNYYEIPLTAALLIKDDTRRRVQYRPCTHILLTPTLS